MIALSSFRTLRVAALLFLAGSGLQAAGPYLTGVDPLSLLPPPTVWHTPEDNADRDSAYQVYLARTPADLARGKAEHKVTVFAFQPAVGPLLQPGRLPRLEALFQEITAEVEPVTNKAKAYWNRQRPYVADPVRFSEPGDQESNAAYPSGHSTKGTIFALVLAEIFPGQRAAILEKGRLIGWTRVEIGVHTPQDIYAGRVLGQAVAQALLRDPAFQSDLAAVRAEVAAAGG